MIVLVQSIVVSFHHIIRVAVMRALTEEETRMVFEKLHKFIGKAIKSLVGGAREDAGYCLRLQKGRVYYVREDLMRRATNVARDKLVGLGVCIGKFTHGGKFRLTVGSLDVLAKHAKYKVRCCCRCGCCCCCGCGCGCCCCGCGCRGVARGRIPFG